MAEHTGKWEYHDDDCMCATTGRHCNRDAWCWSCCGSCMEDSKCSGRELHPTHWNHPAFSSTLAGYDAQGRAVYKGSREESSLRPDQRLHSDQRLPFRPGLVERFFLWLGRWIS